MLTLQSAASDLKARQGSQAAKVAEPRAVQADPAIPGRITRQRLAELAERLARVQALGGESAGWTFLPN